MVFRNSRPMWVCDIDRADGEKTAILVRACSLDEAIYQGVKKSKAKTGDRLRVFLPGYRYERAVEIDEQGKPQAIGEED